MIKQNFFSTKMPPKRPAPPSLNTLQKYFRKDVGEIANATSDSLQCDKQEKGIRGIDETNKVTAEIVHENQAEKNPKEIVVEKNEAGIICTKTKTYAFQETWKTGRDWLSYDENLKAMFCTVCQSHDKTSRSNTFRDNGCCSLRKRMVEVHEKTPAHLKAMEARTAFVKAKDFQTPIQKSVLRLEEKEIKQLQMLFKIAFHIAKQNMPFTAFRSEIQLLRCVGCEVSETYNNDKQAKTFISYISKDMKSNLVASLKKSIFFSIMADGSTDRSECNEEIIYIRFLENGKAVTKFVTLQQVQRIDAKSIKNSLEGAMTDCLNLSLEETKTRLIACTLDGAASNFGAKNGVYKLLRDSRSHLLGIHCCAHRLELAVKDVMKSSKSFIQMESALNDLSVVYKYSSKNWAELQTVGESLETRVLKPIQVRGVRWLPHHDRAIDVLLKCYEPFMIHLESLSLTGSAKNKERAASIVKTMKSVQFALFLNPFSRLVKLLSSLSKVLQANDTGVDYALRKVEAILNNLKDLTDLDNLMKFSDWNTENGVKIVSEQIMFQKVNLSASQHSRAARSSKLQEKPTSVAEELDLAKMKILKEVQHTVKLCIFQIEERFESFVKDPLLSAFSVFEPQYWPSSEQMESYGNKEIENLWSHFQIPLEENSFNKVEAIIQWKMLKKHVKDMWQNHKNIHRNQALELWQKVIADDDGKYKDILSLVQIGLVIPVNTAECERGFSLMGRVKNDWRCSLQSDTLTDLMRICLSEERVDTFCPENAVLQWWKSTKRRMETKPYGERSEKDMNDDSDCWQPISDE